MYFFIRRGAASDLREKERRGTDVRYGKLCALTKFDFSCKIAVKLTILPVYC